MNFRQVADTVLRRGTLLKLYYNNKNNDVSWALVCNKELANKINIATNVDVKTINILTESEFDLQHLFILGIEYIGLPDNILFTDLTEQTALTREFGETFLLQMDEYLNNVKNYIIKEYASYITFLTQQTELYEKSSSELISDLYFIRFFPEKCNLTKDEIVEKIKLDAIEKYHLSRDNNESPRSVLRYFGMRNSAANISDERFIASLKRVWYNFIDQHAQRTLKNLAAERTRYEIDAKNFDQIKEKYDGVFTKTDFLAYASQFAEYEDLIKALTPEILNGLDTVESILSFWPAVIMPQPFLYDDY
ncbi:MAG: hypothetical protein EBX50_09775 [Chitinophagia bacterium]|nr:hypothetical protein [Chitinophagia bacterium]